MDDARRSFGAAALVGALLVGTLAVWMLRRGDDSSRLQPATSSPAGEVVPQLDREVEDAGPLVVEPGMSDERIDELVEQTFARGDEVEPLAPDRLAAYLPKSVQALRRVDATAERSDAAGLDTAVARARYVGAGRDLELRIADLGGPKGVAAFAAWALFDDQDDQGPTGYERIYREGDRVYYQEWDREDSRGQQSVLLAGRYEVTVTGTADSEEVLTAALEAVDVGAIEKLAGR